MRIRHPRLGSWQLRLIAATVAALMVASAGFAQRRGGRGGGFGRPGMYDVATPESFDGAFNFCRVAFSNASNGAGAGWSVDYPRADQNLPTRLAELTKALISRDRSGLPNHLLLRFTDPELFHCPFVMITEPGGLFLYDEEAAALQEYLLKGGFLWADDFWGEYAWDVWESQIRKALPSGPYPIKDLPLDHPLFHMMFDIREVTQIASINYWRGSGGGTSENGFDSRVPHARAISDDHGRIMVLITHNTDFGDSWEQEAQDPEFFERFSVPGYAFGINSVLYAMTH